MDVKRILKSIFIASAAASTIYYSAWLFYLLFISKLRKIPGSILYVMFGSIALQLEQILSDQKPMTVRRRMHEKYGPIVRIGPNELSIGEPSLARQVLVFEDFPKSASAAGLFGPMHPNAIVCLTEKAEHRKIRRFLSPAFSIKGIDKFEPVMHKVSDELVAKINRVIDESGTNEAIIDIWHELHSASIEVLGRCAFGRKFNVIVSYSPFASYVEGMMKYLSMTANVSWIRGIPWLPLNKSYRKMQNYCEAYMQNVVDERRAQGEGKSHDFLELLVHGRDMETNEKQTDRQIMAQIMNFLTAGGDSTAGAMSFTVLCLLDHPHSMTKYLQEVLTCPIDPTTNRLVTNHIKNSKYINACMTETLRMFTGRDFQRAAPSGPDSTVGGYKIPAGTTVNISRYSLHRHYGTWGNPDVFNPERFIDEDSDSSNFFAFSQGS